jgi:hypothetical protein
MLENNLKNNSRDNIDKLQYKHLLRCCCTISNFSNLIYEYLYDSTYIYFYKKNNNIINMTSLLDNAK